MLTGNMSLSKIVNLLCLFTLTFFIATASTSHNIDHSKQLKSFSLEVTPSPAPAKPTQEHEPKVLVRASIQIAYDLCRKIQASSTAEVMHSNGNSYHIRAPPYYA